MPPLPSTASIKSGTSSSTRSRRPPSPPSMYQFDFVQPKVPKPLPKIEKKVKPPKEQKVKAEPPKKAKEEKQSAPPDPPSRGFSIWGVKGKRKVAQDPAPPAKKPIPAVMPPPLPPTSQPPKAPLVPPPPVSAIAFVPPPPLSSVKAKPSRPETPVSTSPAPNAPPALASLSKALPATPILTPPRPPTPPSQPSLVKEEESITRTLSSPPQTSSLGPSSAPAPSLSGPPSYLPPSPDFHVLCEDDIQFKRVEKLTRTLGEQPPLELVFPSFKRTYAANDQFPPPDNPLFVGPQIDNSSHLADKTKEKDTSLHLPTHLIRRNSASLLSLPVAGITKSSKSGQRPATASSPHTPFSSLSPINTALASRPATAHPSTPTSTPTSTLSPSPVSTTTSSSSSRRPSTASAVSSSSISSRDFYYYSPSPPSPSPSPSPSRPLFFRDRMPFASHESLSSATTTSTASSSSCYSVDTLSSTHLDGCPSPTCVVDVQSYGDEEVQGGGGCGRHGYIPIILDQPPPSPITAKPEPIKTPTPVSTILERNEPLATPDADADDELAAYEEGFAYFKSSPLPLPLPSPVAVVAEDAPPPPPPPPTLRTFTRAPVVAAPPPRPVRRKQQQPPTKEYSYSSYSHTRARRPSTAPASPALDLAALADRDRRPSTPFIDTLVPVEDNTNTNTPEVQVRASPVSVSVKVVRPGPGLGLASRRERRQGWSGEWNREDMQDVIKKLRTLK